MVGNVVCEYREICTQYHDFGCIGYYTIRENGSIIFDSGYCKHDKDINEIYEKAGNAITEPGHGMTAKSTIANMKDKNIRNGSEDSMLDRFRKDLDPLNEYCF